VVLLQSIIYTSSNDYPGSIAVALARVT